MGYLDQLKISEELLERYHHIISNISDKFPGVKFIPTSIHDEFVIIIEDIDQYPNAVEIIEYMEQVMKENIK